MKLRKYIILFFLVLFLPYIVSAKEYKDVVAPIAKIPASDKVTIYLFHGDGCPHCREEQIFLNEIKDIYKDKINIVKYEVWYNKDNDNLYTKVKNYFKSSAKGVPFTVVGETYFIGYNKSVGENIKDKVDSYINFKPNDDEIIDEKTEDKNENKSETTIPILGKIDMKKVSIPLVAVILGALDGFNPCAMWVLLFLINMLFTIKNRKKMWILGFAFLFSSAFVYFLAMLGLNIVLSFTAINFIRALIGLVALTGGIINIRSYLKTKDNGCHIVDDKRRKKYFNKIKNFVSTESFIISLIGVITLACSVNLVELACSAGFPTIFIELLNINNLTKIEDVFYILIYIFFFLIDDLVVFIIAMTSLKLTGISTKYNRISHLIGGIIMILMGILLIFKPEWLMFNFS